MNKRMVREFAFLAYLLVCSMYIYGEKHDSIFLRYMQIAFPVSSLLVYNTYLKRSSRINPGDVMRETSKVIGDIVVLCSVPAMYISGILTAIAPLLYLASYFRDRGMSAEIGFLVAFIICMSFIAVIGFVYQGLRDDYN
jgi:hypothetical protein